MNKRKIVTGIGELLWDLLPMGKQLGGAPCNFSFHASQAGCESYVVSAVGDDIFGRELSRVLASLSLNDNYVQRNSWPTGSVSVEIKNDGHPEYIIHEDVAWDYVEWNDKLASLARKTDAVCFGSLAQRNTISRQTITKFLNAVSGKCLKVFDINLRQNFYTEEIINQSLEYANVLKLNEEELPVVASVYSINGNVENQLRVLKEKFRLEYIAYTMGGEGSFLLSKDELSIEKTPKVKVVDTVGAGDSFTAILISGILNEIPLKEIHKMATGVAAYVCECQGATPLVDKELLQYFLKE